MRLQHFLSIATFHLFERRAQNGHNPVGKKIDCQLDREEKEANMAPTEQIIWEARHKPGSLKGSRRSSTVVDTTGCKITIGFILPRRPSSQSSSASSSEAQTPGTPASPLEEASPGFHRPTGSLYHAPEMAILRSDSESSLHRPSTTATVHRPPQFGGRSHTFNGGRASCWYEGGPITTTVPPPPARDATPSSNLTNPQKSMRRAMSDHTGLISMQARGTSRTDSHHQRDASSCAIIGSIDEENAIESDSEYDDDDDFVTACNRLQASGIAAQRSRPTYAQRRAMADQRVNLQKDLPPLPLPPFQPAQKAIRLTVGTKIQCISAALEEDAETPIEVKSFSYGEMVPHHVLHPSRSRPRPIKGVLKKAGSRSSSEDSGKHVHTAIRRGSGSVVNGKVVRDRASQSD